jgi:ribonucleoside-diphosphate reductase alpha chain
MPSIPTLSTAILRLLADFGEERLKKVLAAEAINAADAANETSTAETPADNDPQVQADREELLSLLEGEIYSYRPQFEITEKRPVSLECDVVKFQNKKEKWVAFVGLLDGYPYEIFTGVLDDEDGIALPKTVTKGFIIKHINEDGTKRYDFTFVNRRGYKTTVEGLSERFNKEYWNYAKLISGVLRYRMPLTHVIKLISSLQLDDENINTWTNGVARALKKYTVSADTTDAIDETDELIDEP